MNPQGRCIRAGAFALALLIFGTIAGCASTPRDREARDPYDPLEPLNRKIFAFNMAADRMVLRPIARGYDKVTPRPVKSGITNFFDNLATPIWVLNHLLQGELAEAGRQSGRFLLNSTGGILGLFDIAGDGGIQEKSANFNQTFGRVGRAVRAIPDAAVLWSQFPPCRTRLVRPIPDRCRMELPRRQAEHPRQAYGPGHHQHAQALPVTGPHD
jgi:hypothetical protein